MRKPKQLSPASCSVKGGRGGRQRFTEITRSSGKWGPIQKECKKHTAGLPAPPPNPSLGSFEEVFKSMDSGETLRVGDESFPALWEKAGPEVGMERCDDGTRSRAVWEPSIQRLRC